MDLYSKGYGDTDIKKHVAFGTHSFPLLNHSSVFTLGPLGGLQWEHVEMMNQTFQSLPSMIHLQKDT